MLVIDTWLMSCRVLKRGVEALLLNYLFAAAKKRGLSRLVGDYLPTAKNDLVREHYRTLGFTRIGDSAGGQTRWELRVDEQWKARLHFIKEIESDEPIAV